MILNDPLLWILRRRTSNSWSYAVVRFSFELKTSTELPRNSNFNTNESASYTTFFLDLQGCFMPLWSILSIPNNFLGNPNGSNTLHYTQRIIMTNCFFIKSQKMQLKWTKLFKNDNFKWLFILLWKWK